MSAMADSSAPQTLTVDGLVAWPHTYAALIGEHEDELTELDAASITDVLALDAEPATPCTWRPPALGPARWPRHSRPSPSPASAISTAGRRAERDPLGRSARARRRWATDASDQGTRPDGWT